MCWGGKQVMHRFDHWLGILNTPRFLVANPSKSVSEPLHTLTVPRTPAPVEALRPSWRTWEDTPRCTCLQQRCNGAGDPRHSHSHTCGSRNALFGGSALNNNSSNNKSPFAELCRPLHTPIPTYHHTRWGCCPGCRVGKGRANKQQACDM